MAEGEGMSLVLLGFCPVRQSSLRCFATPYECTELAVIGNLNLSLASSSSLSHLTCSNAIAPGVVRFSVRPCHASA